MRNRILAFIVATGMPLAGWADQIVDDDLVVNQTLWIGGYATQIMGNYNGSPWFINTTGRFTFGAHHDWDRSFDIYLPNAEGGNTVEIGQRHKNNPVWNYETIKFRNADILIGDGKDLHVEGSIGIGDTTPDAMLSIKDVGGFDDIPLIAFCENTSAVNEFELKGYFAGTGENGNKLVLGSGNGGAWSPDIMSWVGNGNVGIGTLTPGNKLEVNGTIRSKEIIVESTGWPDYVFDDGYELPGLKEVERHIDEKGYLPGVEPASTVDESGQSLGAMQRQMMQKIEELTLYMIEQEKETSLLKAENSRLGILEMENGELSRRLARLEGIIGAGASGIK